MSRRTSMRLNDALDRWVPPALRDSWLFARAARSMYGDLPIPIDELKDRAFTLSPEEYGDFYRNLQTRFDQGDTDLTPESLEAVVASIARRHRARRRVRQGIPRRRCSRVTIASSASTSPWQPATARSAIGARSSAKRTSSAFPSPTIRSTPSCRRTPSSTCSTSAPRSPSCVGSPRSASSSSCPGNVPYRVTFNPHIHFFPYKFSVLAWTGTDRPYRCELAGGDWLYVEEQTG